MNKNYSIFEQNEGRVTRSYMTVSASAHKNALVVITFKNTPDPYTSLIFFSYRKIPTVSPGAYVFQGLFLRGLFLEGLIFGGTYLRRKICVSKSIGLALQLEVNSPFLLCFTLYFRAIFQVQASGGLYLEAHIQGGAYFRNFTV